MRHLSITFGLAVLTTLLTKPAHSAFVGSDLLVQSLGDQEVAWAKKGGWKGSKGWKAGGWNGYKIKRHRPPMGSGVGRRAKGW